jgi:hypothetical protein
MKTQLNKLNVLIRLTILIGLSSQLNFGRNILSWPASLRESQALRLDSQSHLAYSKAVSCSIIVLPRVNWGTFCTGSQVGWQCVGAVINSFDVRNIFLLIPKATDVLHI